MSKLKLFLLLTCCFSCSQNNEFSINSYFDELGIKGNEVFVINLDGCSSCISIYQSSVNSFSEDGRGKVLILSSSRTKANFFLKLSGPNVFWDRPFELIENSYYEETPLLFILEDGSFIAKPITNPKILDK